MFCYFVGTSGLSALSAFSDPGTRLWRVFFCVLLTIIPESFFCVCRSNATCSYSSMSFSFETLFPPGSIVALGAPPTDRSSPIHGTRTFLSLTSGCSVIILWYIMSSAASATNTLPASSSFSSKATDEVMNTSDPPKPVPLTLSNDCPRPLEEERGVPPPCDYGRGFGVWCSIRDVWWVSMCVRCVRLNRHARFMYVIQNMYQMTGADRCTGENTFQRV